MDELSSPLESGGQQSRPSAIDTILKDTTNEGDVEVKKQSMINNRDKKQAAADKNKILVQKNSMELSKWGVLFFTAIMINLYLGVAKLFEIRSLTLWQKTDRKKTKSRKKKKDF